ncbi:MAG: PocR ligand-binding domain-containing protein [Limnochordia bacterium]|jgi:AraC-like DNA-binding protein
MEDARKPKLLEEAIQAVSRVSGASVCIYDLKSLLEGVHGSAIRGNRGHMCSFCQRLHDLPGGLDACVKCDTEETVALAGQYKRRFFRTCHAGLTEIVIPVMRHGELIAVAFCGQARLRGETSWESVLARIRPYGPDPSEFLQYLQALPMMDRQTLSAAATLLDLSLRYLVEVTSRWTLESLAITEPADPIAEALKFIGNHYHEGIGAGDVAAHVHLDPSYLARLFRRRLGHTITHQIALVRIESARQLCASTTIPLSSIASNVGYTSYPYFASVFRRITGESPSRYRARHAATAGDDTQEALPLAPVAKPLHR